MDPLEAGSTKQDPAYVSTKQDPAYESSSVASAIRATMCAIGVAHPEDRDRGRRG